MGLRISMAPAVSRAGCCYAHAMTEAPFWTDLPLVVILTAGLFMAGVVVMTLRRKSVSVDDPLRALGSQRSPSEDLMHQVAELVAAGRKVEAVKVYREATGAELKESVEAVSGLEPPSLDRDDVDAGRPLSEEDKAQVIRLIAEGKKLDAIRAYREATGAGLKQSIQAVEQESFSDAAPGGGAAAMDQDALDAELRRLRSEGRAIEAVKLARDRLGLGLSAAKDYVDRLA